MSEIPNYVRSRSTLITGHSRSGKLSCVSPETPLANKRCGADPARAPKNRHMYSA